MHWSIAARTVAAAPANEISKKRNAAPRIKSLLLKDKTEIEQLRAENAFLGEMLAVIHRDGGHYQATHGSAKAVEDAITKWYKLATENAELQRRMGLMREHMSHKQCSGGECWTEWGSFLCYHPEAAGWFKTGGE